MTVCVAAISEYGTIVGAADTMLSVGDIEFEPGFNKERTPRFTKIFPLTNSIVLMMAGDMAIQAEILFSHLSPAINQWIKEHGDRQMTVEEAVHQYCDAYNMVRHARVQRAVLSPLGLTVESFHQKQKYLDPAFTTKVSNSLTVRHMPETSSIIVGVEPVGDTGQITRSRLFVLDGDDVHCHDMARFAAVGAGSRHAESHFMLSHYGAEAGLQETVLSTYTAKKKAEVAPGVGSSTTMFVLGPMINSFRWVVPEAQELIDATYRELVRTQEGALAKAFVDLNNVLTDLNKKAQSQSTLPEPPAS